VDIRGVPGRGPGGRITRDDVKAHAKRLIEAQRPSGAAAGAAAVAGTAELPDFRQWGEVEREPLSALRRAAARNLAQSWAVIPHVTQFDRADVTQLESMRKRFNERPEAAGRKLSVTAIALKVVAAALRRFPRFNASLDLAAGEVVLKRYVHLGVAVDTERGLVVPVVREADGKRLLELSAEVERLAARARDGKLAPDEMRGACFTVTNLGGLGTTYFSPIVPWPEVAILGLGRAELQAVPVERGFEPRRILPLSLSYDHRLIDGADAARFLRWIAEALEQPLILLLEASGE
jgi:pyruvate dehydrogenase E2 component (dihydrolipoamide acetyltransferase)